MSWLDTTMTAVASVGLLAGTALVLFLLRPLYKVLLSDWPRRVMAGFFTLIVITLSKAGADYIIAIITMLPSEWFPRSQEILTVAISVTMVILISLVIAIAAALSVILTVVLTTHVTKFVGAFPGSRAYIWLSSLWIYEKRNELMLPSLSTICASILAFFLWSYFLILALDYIIVLPSFVPNVDERSGRVIGAVCVNYPVGTWLRFIDQETIIVAVPRDDGAEPNRRFAFSIETCERDHRG